MDQNTMIVWIVGIIIGCFLLYGLFRSSAWKIILEKLGIHIEKDKEESEQIITASGVSTVEENVQEIVGTWKQVITASGFAKVKKNKQKIIN